MINEILLKLPYLLIFLPLIMSVFVNFVSDKKILSFLNFGTLLTLLTISVFLLINVFFINKSIFVSVDNNVSILGTEYKINSINIFYIMILLLINLIGFLNYHYEYALQKTIKISYKKNFYSIYFLHLFSMIGILTTYNTFNLFIFIELFSFSTFSLINSYREKSINVAVYKYFTNNIFGSMILACSIFYMTMFFNTNDILLIKQQIQTLDLSKNYFIVFIYMLIFISITLKFLMFTATFKIEKKKFLTIMSIENIFITTIIGLFLVYFFTNFVFLFNNSIFMFTNVRKIILFFSLMVVIHTLYETIIRTDTIYDVFLNLFLIDIIYIFISIFFTGANNFHKAHLLSLIEFTITSVPLYFISIYFSEKYNDNNLNLLNKQKILSIFLLSLVIYKLSIPCTANFYLLKIFLSNSILKNDTLFIFIKIFSEIILIVLIIKVILNMKLKTEIEECKIMKFQDLKYKISFLLLFLFIVFINFCIFKFI